MLALAAGAMIGLAIAVAVSELIPGPPRLQPALARLEGRAHLVPDKDNSWLVRRLRRFPIPRDDLALIGISVERFALQRVGFAALGLVLPTVLQLACLASGVPVPWPAGPVTGLIVGAVFALVPEITARRQAAERRREFRVALSTYLDLVALERAAGAGPPQALQAPADVCTGWVFTRIAAVLQQAKRAGEQPWRGLAALGERLGVTELTELADITQDAGTEGAQVLSTLLAKAQSMRSAALSDARARANSRTSEMPVAIATTVIGFLILVCFPAVYRIFIP
jgi:tight adherence protein C